MKFTDGCPTWSPSLWMKWPSRASRASNIQEAEQPNAEDADTLSNLAWLRNLSIDDINRLFECTPAQVALICAVVAGGAYNGLSFPSVVFQLMNGWKIGQATPVVQLSVYFAIPFLILSGINQLADIHDAKDLKNARTTYDAFQDGFSAYFFTLLAVLAFTEFFTNNVSLWIFFLLNIFPIFMGVGQLILGLSELNYFSLLNRNKTFLKKIEPSFDALQNGFTLQSFITYFSSVIQTALHPTLKLIAWIASVLFAIFIPYYLKERHGFNADKIDKVWDFLSGFTYFLGVLQTFQQNGKAFYSPGAAWIDQTAIVALVSIVLPLVTIYKFGFDKDWYVDETQEPELPQNLEKNIESSPSCCAGISAFVGKSLTKILHRGRAISDTESEGETMPLVLPVDSQQNSSPSRCVIS